jgi:hypothetical protein
MEWIDKCMILRLGIMRQELREVVCGGKNYKLVVRKLNLKRSCDS